jgi:hypothetical protein
MKKTILIISILLVLFYGCSKNADSSGSSNTATITFTNQQPFGLRVVLSSTDSLAPFTNVAMDVDLAAGSSVTKSIPEGRRWLYGMIVCKAGQPFNAPCTTM